MRNVFLFHSRSLTVLDANLPANGNRSILTHELIRAYQENGGAGSMLSSLSVIEVEKVDLQSEEYLLREFMESYHSSDYINQLLSLKNSISKYENSDSDSDSNSDSDSDSDEDYGLCYDCPRFPNLPDYILNLAKASMTLSETVMAKLMSQQEESHHGKTGDVYVFWEGGRHHSQRSKGNGFCYINDVVLIVGTLLPVVRAKGKKTIVIDIDIHFGDGTAAAFASSADPESLLYFDFHCHSKGFYPCSSKEGSCSAYDNNHDDDVVDDVDVVDVVDVVDDDDDDIDVDDDDLTLNAGAEGYDRSCICPIRIPTDVRNCGESIERIFSHLITRLYDIYEDEIGLLCIVCGFDGIDGDPIGAAQVNWTGFSAWNIEKMLRFAISTLSCPVIILGGGGYDPCTFSSSATFVTNSLVSGTPESIDLQIPEHDFYSHYKKCGFELSLGGTQEKGYHNVHHNVKLNIYHDDQNRRWELTSIDKINKFLF